MNRKLLLQSSLFLSVLLLFLYTSDGMQSYVRSVKLKRAESRQVFARADTYAEETWRARLISEAAKLRIEPKNARVDRVWKAIPGYNGLEVDIDKTLKLLMSHPPSSAIPFVYREIEPDVKLADLPPNPIYKGNPDKPIVSFMINVAWGNEYLPGILKTLREENVKATFFLDGSWLKNNMQIARIILADGHELSNHAYSHKMMSRLSRSAAEAEIAKTEALLRELGVENRLFAPPSGDYDEETVRIARQFNLYTILWTIDTVDWQKPSSDSIYRKITSRLEPGALILMHPTESSRGALGDMIRFAKKQGYVVGTVSDLISETRIPTVERQVDF